MRDSHSSVHMCTARMAGLNNVLHNMCNVLGMTIAKINKQTEFALWELLCLIAAHKLETWKESEWASLKLFYVYAGEYFS